MLKEIKEKAAALRTGYTKKRDSIQADKNLSDGGRFKKLTDLKNDFVSQIRQLKKDYANATSEKVAELEKELFSIGHKFGATEADRQSKQQSYRNAITQAEALTKEKDLEQLLSQAEKTGDPILARAIGFASKEKGFFNLTFKALGEDHAEQLDDLLTLQYPSAEQQFSDNVVFSTAD